LTETIISNAGKKMKEFFISCNQWWTSFGRPFKESLKRQKWAGES
jgi:hypothetical protein